MDSEQPVEQVKAEPVACPFCGNDGKGSIEDALHVSMQEHDWRDASWSVQCDKCTATMGYSDSEDEAIAAWNQRATPQPAAVDGLVRAAKAILHQFSHAGADGWYSDAIHKDDVDALDAALAQIERKPEDGNG